VTGHVIGCVDLTFLILSGVRQEIENKQRRSPRVGIYRRRYHQLPKDGLSKKRSYSNLERGLIVQNDVQQGAVFSHLESSRLKRVRFPGTTSGIGRRPVDPPFSIIAGRILSSPSPAAAWFCVCEDACRLRSANRRFGTDAELREQ
jgi:hypothetical protein